MSKSLLALATACFISSALFSQTIPKRELRAAWIATYVNIDWPTSRTLTPAQEQAEFITRLNEHKATGMNALFVQVRSQCDAMYPSPYDPWSADLTGTQGTAPSPYYDPLEFMINESRKRGMEFHAWMNPYRALASATTANLNALAANHVVKLHPEWIMKATPATGNQQYILNPGAPEVWEYVIGVVMDVVRRYDLDGIHFDDYFYPYPATGTYNDDSVYNIHNRGIANRADWRRSNVDTLVKRLNDSIKTVKPWVKFGISPSGIWLSLANDAVNGSNTSSGAIQHYKDLYANSRKWLQQGWLDYIAPQIYWYIGQTGSDYNILAPWWNNNAFGRHIYSGMAGYKVGDAAQNAAFATDNTQIPKQIRLNRSLPNIYGNIVYNTTSLRNNKLGFRDSLRTNFYAKPALRPAMAWKDNIAPEPATALNGLYNGSNAADLTWTKPAATTDELNKVKQFAIYRSETSPVDIAVAENLIAITFNDTAAFADSTVQTGKTYYYVVTALDRLHNESVVTNTAAVNVGTLPLQLLMFELRKATASTVSLNWKTSHEKDFSHFELERSTDGGRYSMLAKIAGSNNAGVNNYGFDDVLNNVHGNLYYRLKLVDKNGAAAYSPVRSVLLKSGGIKVYPTLLSKGGTLQLQLDDAGIRSLQYRLTNSAGKMLMQGLIPVSGMRGQLSLAGNITAGTYYLQCMYNGVQEQVMVIVQ